MLIKIGDAALKFNLSNRTLRYWEEAGILSSIRLENGYRCYDEENIKRIKQIMMLRKLRMPIQDIQRIYTAKSNELVCAVEALRRHLEVTRQEAGELQALTVVLERLVAVVSSRQNLSEVFEGLDVLENAALMEIQQALRITPPERDNGMSENLNPSKIKESSEVRIVKLPRMVLACYRAESSTPEKDCADRINKLIYEHNLHKKYGFRHFGFNNPDPRDGDLVYGYEMWVVVPEDFAVPEPFTRKVFEGGLFAAIPTQLTIIGERWMLLWEWATHNTKYEVDWNPEIDRRYLEECIDFISFNSEETDENEKQLDLLAPVRLKKN